MPTSAVSLLSYNINLLPFGKQYIPSHANKDERMSQFISLVSHQNNNNSNNQNNNNHNNNNNTDNNMYDILALQEVYGSPFLPSFAVPTLCRQTRMIEQLRTRGFPYHAACESPTFFSMISKKTFTDSGLVILSKFPIEHVGSVAFSQPSSTSLSSNKIKNTTNNKRKPSSSPNKTSPSRESGPSGYVNDYFGNEDDDDNNEDDDDEGSVIVSDSKTISNSTSTAKAAGQPGCLFAAIRVNNTNSTQDNVSSSTSSSSSSSLLLVFNVHLSLCNKLEHSLDFLEDEDTVALSSNMMTGDETHKNEDNASQEGPVPRNKPRNTHSTNKIQRNNNNNNNRNKFSNLDNNIIIHGTDADFGLTRNQRSQVTELRHFIEGVLQQFPLDTPFIICGDFNVNALYQVDEIGTTRPSRAYCELKSMLTPLLILPTTKNNNNKNDQNESNNNNNNNVASSSVPSVVTLHEAVLEALGYHPATRPVSAASQLADSPFSSYVGGVNQAKSQYQLYYSRQQGASAGGGGGYHLRSQEMRHDYIFYGVISFQNNKNNKQDTEDENEKNSRTVIGLATNHNNNNNNKQQSCKIERFAMPEGSFPFRFLSDHFALIVKFEINHHHNTIYNNKLKLKNSFTSNPTSPMISPKNSTEKNSNNSSSSRENTPARLNASSSSTEFPSSSRSQNNNSSKNMNIQSPDKLFAQVQNTLANSAFAISMYNAFSFLVQFLAPQDVKHQRSGTFVPIGAAEVVVFAMMVMWMPVWIVVLCVAGFLCMIAGFFLIIQKRERFNNNSNNDTLNQESESDFYFQIARIEDETVSGIVPITLDQGNTKKTLLPPTTEKNINQNNDDAYDNDSETERKVPPDDSTKIDNTNDEDKTVAELWHQSVSQSSWLPCLGPSLFLSHCYSHGWLDQPYAHDDTTAAEVIADFHHSFLTYSEADRLAVSLANGMLALCASLPEISNSLNSALPTAIQQQISPLSTGENNINNNNNANATYRVGVLLQSSPMSLLIDLAFLVYGHVRLDDVYELPNIAPLIAVPLVGETNALRAELDDTGCNVAITTVSQAHKLLTCHARHLHTVIVVPDEPVYSLRQSSAGFNPLYHQSQNKSSPSSVNSGENDQRIDHQENAGKQRRQQQPFQQEINVPVLTGAAASLHGRDVSSIPSSLELLATENSIQMVSMGELLHNGCILTREGRFQKQENNANEKKAEEKSGKLHSQTSSGTVSDEIVERRDENEDSSSKNNNSKRKSISTATHYNNRIPTPEDFAMVMLDCRSTEDNYVSVTSPFHTKRNDENSNNAQSRLPPPPIYGRLLRLTHKNISRFVVQMSETGLIPSPSWCNQEQQQQNTNNHTQEDANKNTTSSKIDASQRNNNINNSKNKNKNNFQNNNQSRILFQDIHSSYFERWAALCAVLSGHTAIVTRSTATAIPSSAEIVAANSTMNARAFHGSCIALKPHIAFTSLLPLISTREIYDKIVSCGFSGSEFVQNAWSFAFRNIVRFRDQLNERNFDSSLLYRLFFARIATTFFGTRIQRVVICSDEAVPYRVRHLLQLLLPPATTSALTFSNNPKNNNNNHQHHHAIFVTASFAANVGVVHVNGTPPPRTLIKIWKNTNSPSFENENSSSSSNLPPLLSGEIDVSGPAVLTVDKDSAGFASSGLIGEWHKRKQKHQHEQNENNNNSNNSSKHLRAKSNPNNYSQSGCRWTLQVLCAADSLVQPGSVSNLQALISKILFSSSSSSSSLPRTSKPNHHKYILRQMRKLASPPSRSRTSVGGDDEEEEEMERTFVQELISESASSSLPLASSSSLERSYIQESGSLISDLLIWCHGGLPLVAIVVPNRPVLIELLVSRIAQLRQEKKQRQMMLRELQKQNEGDAKENSEGDDRNDKNHHKRRSELNNASGATNSATTNAHNMTNATDDELMEIEGDTAMLAALHADPSILFRSEVASDIVLRSCQLAFINAGLSHEILAVHLHPHPFTAHTDFSRANGNRRRSRMAGYFMEHIDGLYMMSIRELTWRIQNNKDNKNSDNELRLESNASFSSVDGKNSEEISPSSPNSKNGNRIDGNSPHNSSSPPQNHDHDGISNKTVTTTTTTTNIKKKIRPVAPFAVDIGGTCAKVVFFLPGDADPRGMIPSYCTIEKNDPSTACLGASVDASAIQSMMNDAAVAKYGHAHHHHHHHHQNQTHLPNITVANSPTATNNFTETSKNKKKILLPSPSASSTLSSPPSVSFRLVCMKLPTTMVPRFIQHLATAPLLGPSSPTSSGVAAIVGSTPLASEKLQPQPPSPNNIHLRTHSTASNMSASSQTLKSPNNNNNNNSGSTPNSALTHFSSSFVPPSLLASAGGLQPTSKLNFMFTKEALQNVPATGGGAFRFQGATRSQLGLRLEPVKEMDSLVKGLNLLLELCPDLAVFSYDTRTNTQARHKLTMQNTESKSNTKNKNDDDHNDDQNKQSATSSSSSSPYPFLLVNVGSGVSIVKMGSSDGSFARVGGSPVGGATFWGLARAMTNIQSWDELREITRVDGPGDNTKVDLLVGDIYGYNATALPAGLSVDTLASSFGKVGSTRTTTTTTTTTGMINNDNSSNNISNSEKMSSSKNDANNNNNNTSPSNQVESSSATMNGGGGSVSTAVAGKLTKKSFNSSAQATMLDDDTTELLNWTREVAEMENNNNNNLELKNKKNENSGDDDLDDDEDFGSVYYSYPANGKRNKKNNNGGVLDSNNATNEPSSGMQTITKSKSFDHNNNVSTPANEINNTNNNNNNNENSSSTNQAANNNNNNNNNMLPPPSLSSVDVIRSLLLMVATNITQIAYLYAKQEGVKNILFTGGFVRGNALVWSRMTFALNYWSSGQMTAHFLRNDGYVGVLGALLNYDQVEHEEKREFAKGK